MPSKKKKYNARFPASRIKKIMQTDEEVGKVAQAVPVIISKALEMFIESLLKKSSHITQNRNAKTLTPSHMKQCILSESRFDFLKDLVKNIPDASIQEDNENNALADSNVNFGIIPDDLAALPPVEARLPPPKEKRKDNPHAEQSSSSGSRTPGVIQFVPKQDNPKFNFTVNSLIGHQEETKTQGKKEEIPFVPSLVPLSTNSSSTYGQSSSTLTGDNLCIDEDYDN